MTGDVALVTGACGLVGAAAVRRFSAMGLEVVGIDDDSRGRYFGPTASTAPVRAELEAEVPGYRHRTLDIRNEEAVAAEIAFWGKRIAAVLHAAAQPSHDWAASDPQTDFAVNATATLGLLEAVRRHAPAATFVFMSTNKVYGDGPNRLPLVIGPTRFMLPDEHPYARYGIDETMPIDRCRHSLFGVSKAAADLMVQEYALRFGLTTVVLRAGCITGPGHRAVAAHGFLAFLAAEVAHGRTYRVIGHAGRQVRDNLHAQDLACAIERVVARPRGPGVYNIGGGAGAKVSVLEALELAGRAAGRRATVEHVDQARYGDHLWWVSDVRAFQADYPGWAPRWDAAALVEMLVAAARN